MGGVSASRPAKVVVLGAGVTGMNATAIALGMHAEVPLLDLVLARLRDIDAVYPGRRSRPWRRTAARSKACSTPTW